MTDRSQQLLELIQIAEKHGFTAQSFTGDNFGKNFRVKVDLNSTPPMEIWWEKDDGQTVWMTLSLEELLFHPELLFIKSLCKMQYGPNWDTMVDEFNVWETDVLCLMFASDRIEYLVKTFMKK